jgi:N-acyl-phosphatidylethanolamine-hydrolysing phospholipase D
MVTVTILSKRASIEDRPAHHVGVPPTSFVNPWPSYSANQVTKLKLFKTKFTLDRPAFIPVPDRSELVPIQKPDWGKHSSGLKVTWIGHASFLIETSKTESSERGVRIVFDPLFSERTTPYNISVQRDTLLCHVHRMSYQLWTPS